MKKMIVGVFLGIGLMTHALYSMENKQVALNQFIDYYAKMTDKLFKQTPRCINDAVPKFSAVLILNDWNDCQICEILNGNLIRYESCGWLIDAFGDGKSGSPYGIQVYFSDKDSLYSYEKIKKAYATIIRCLRNSWEGKEESGKEEYYLMTKKKLSSLYKEKKLIELMIKKLGFSNIIEVQEDGTTISLWMKKNVASEFFRIFFQ